MPVGWSSAYEAWHKGKRHATSRSPWRHFHFRMSERMPTSQIAQPQPPKSKGKPVSGSDANGSDQAHEEGSKDTIPQVGRRIFAIRKARNLTLCDVQKKSGISISVLSQIERGKVNPSFSTLWQLTQSLEIDFGELLERSVSGVSRAQVVERVDSQSTLASKSRDGRCVFRMLSPSRLELPVEWYEIELSAGAHVNAHARLDGAREHLTVISGRLSIELGDQATRLKAGETAHFLTKLPHTLRNTGRQALKALLVVMSPFELQSSGRSHYQIDR